MNEKGVWSLLVVAAGQAVEMRKMLGYLSPTPRGTVRPAATYTIDSIRYLLLLLLRTRTLRKTSMWKI